jgi:hypothetical protein
MLLSAHYGSMAAGGAGTEPRYVLIGGPTSPYIEAYTWLAGFGTKYSNPATLPAGGTQTNNSITSTTAGDAVLLAHSVSPFVTAYPWSASGFGTKFANPGTAVLNTGAGCSFKPDGTAVVIGNRTTTAYVQAYAWSGSGFGSRFTQPATTTSNSTYNVDFANNAVARSNSGSSNAEGFVWSSGWSTRYTASVSLSSAEGIRWSTTTATDMAVCPTSGNNLIYPFTTGSGFGSVYSQPASAPGGAQNAFSNDATQYFSGSGAWPFTSGSGCGTKYTDPSPTPTTGGCLDIAGDVILSTSSTSPRLFAYQRLATGYGGKYADPATSPTISPDSITGVL